MMDALRSRSMAALLPLLTRGIKEWPADEGAPPCDGEELVERGAKAVSGAVVVGVVADVEGVATGGAMYGLRLLGAGAPVIESVEAPSTNSKFCRKSRLS